MNQQHNSQGEGNFVKKENKSSEGYAEELLRQKMNFHGCQNYLKITSDWIIVEEAIQQVMKKIRDWSLRKRYFQANTMIS